MFQVAAIMKLLQAVGPITARLPEFKAVYDQIVSTFKGKDDQATLQKAHAELLAENTGGHARLQEMLRKASLDEPTTEAPISSKRTAPTADDAARSRATDLSGKPTPGLS